MARLRQWQSIVNKTLEMIRNNDKVLQYISNSSDEHLSTCICVELILCLKIPIITTITCMWKSDAT